MRPWFTELIHPSVSASTSDTAASAFAASAFAASAFAASAFAASASVFIMEETSDDESNDIPRSLQASAADIRLAEVGEYLQFLVRLQGLSDSDFCKFMQYSSGFFFSNGKLWHRDTHGRHKIVVLKEKRYELLKEVHDILGHKKIYAMRMQLLEHFWWPFLNQDVNGLYRHVTNARSIRCATIISCRQSLPLLHSSAKPMSIPCTCPVPLDTATSFKLAARYRHTQNTGSSEKRTEA
jgi:hypothetical protein